MVHLFTYLILWYWYWIHLKSSIRGVHLLCCFFSFCHFQYDVRVGLMYFLFQEHTWLATLSKRNKDLLEPQIPWRFGIILVVSGGESCACLCLSVFFFPKDLRFVHCQNMFFPGYFLFSSIAIFRCLLLVFFSSFSLLVIWTKSRSYWISSQWRFSNKNPRFFHSLEPNLLTFNIFP